MDQIDQMLCNIFWFLDSVSLQRQKYNIRIIGRVTVEEEFEREEIGVNMMR